MLCNRQWIDVKASEKDTLTNVAALTYNLLVVLVAGHPRPHPVSFVFPSASSLWPKELIERCSRLCVIAVTQCYELLLVVQAKAINSAAKRSMFLLVRDQTQWVILKLSDNFFVTV